MSLLTIEISIGILFAVYVALVFVQSATNKSSKYREALISRKRKKNSGAIVEQESNFSQPQTKSFPPIKLVLYVTAIFISFGAIAWLYFMNN